MEEGGGGPFYKPGPRSGDQVVFEGDAVPLRRLRHQGVQCVSITQIGQKTKHWLWTGLLPRGVVDGALKLGEAATTSRLGVLWKPHRLLERAGGQEGRWGVEYQVLDDEPSFLMTPERGTSRRRGVLA